MLSVMNLSIETLKGRKLIENLSFNLNAGDKLAVIGEEGNGKSTLLKAIFNENLINDYCHVSGQIEKNNAHIAYLEQKLSPEWYDYFVVDYFLKTDIDSEPDYGVYNEINVIERILKKLEFKTEYLQGDITIGQLSGGEKVKLQIAKMMYIRPDIIFLDEPTNDLDISTLKMLENYIKSTNSPIMYISHDETLLENTANMILHIEQLIKKTKPKHTIKRISYIDYINERKRSIEHQTQVAYSERREKAKKEEVLRQIKQKVENALVSAKKDPAAGRIIAKKMSNIKSLEKRYGEEELTEIPDVEEAVRLVIDETITIPKQKIVLNIKMPELSIENNVLAKNIELNIVGPQKVAIVGNNGCGKSTFIKKIVPILKEVSGLKVGYFSQNYYEVLNYDNSAVDELSYTVDLGFNPRTLLGSLKFTREEMEHKIKDLSEGQKAKISLIKLIVEKNNILVLDEPTRNLSPLTNPVIREMLKKYRGAIIAVSHDRKFISELCDDVYQLSKYGLKNIPMHLINEKQC